MKGILGKKAGMTQVYDTHGNCIPTTVVSIPTNIITGKKTPSKDQYSALQIACEECSGKRLPKGYVKEFKKLNSKPMRFKREIRDMDPGDYKLGDTLPLTIFTPGEYVNVTAISKGKGFAGAIKRHNYGRGPMSHGSHHHRRPGSLGAITQNRVFKGKKLPGHMGNEQVTTKNLEILQVDTNNNVLLLKGNTPGNNNTLLIIKEALKAKKETPTTLSNRFEEEAKNKILEEAKKYQLKLTTEMTLAEMKNLLNAVKEKELVAKKQQQEETAKKSEKKAADKKETATKTDVKETK